MLHAIAQTEGFQCLEGGVETCPFCGEPPQIEIGEIWSDGEFTMDTCCEGMLEFAADQASGSDGREFMRELDVEALAGQRLRRVISDDAMLLDWQLEIVDVPQRVAKDFVRAHHGHCGPPAGWKFGAAVRNGATTIGVVMVGRPVARRLDDGTVLEVNRLCVRRDVHSGLVWNACSMLYGWAAREARRRGYRRIITYTLAEEDGTTLLAAGWHRDGTSAGGSWSRPSRARDDAGPTGPKVRWARDLSGQKRRP